MKILYYDCFSGISGDMNLGAMLDLGIEEKYLKDELAKLKISGYEIKTTKEKRKGIEGTNFNVILTGEHNSASHEHKHDHGHTHKHSPLNRNLNDIETIINNSALNENVKALSEAIFLKLAEAEAKVHGKSINEIHFHEVGAVDSIVDIVGTAICIDKLEVDKIFCSSVELGSGYVKCDHGTLPVPAPATAEILKQVPTKTGTIPFETTTPTGAAILATLVDEFTDKMEFSITKVGYGIGNKDGDIPNVLRAYLGEYYDKPSYKNDTMREQATIIECNIDDMSPEFYEYIMEKLFQQGAYDVYITPIIMKKSRPAITLSVLCNNKHEESIVEILFTETTTLGIRKHSVEKVMLKREFTTINTSFGEISVKFVHYNGKVIKAKPEYDDCKKIAIENNVSIQEIIKEVNSILGNREQFNK